ncbi:Uncharacterized protein TCM_012742 [Theobroma cacao]|uniref:Uncharacterized protein n=1 Tax=Theobroma cacao TaxID=3641 RepID=A0A061FVP0_THECC|nr:Uncharacterized protein TCM_012742 [Theobroma cacao]
MYRFSFNSFAHITTFTARLVQGIAKLFPAYSQGNSLAPFGTTLTKIPLITEMTLVAAVTTVAATAVSIPNMVKQDSNGDPARSSTQRSDLVARSTGSGASRPYRTVGSGTPRLDPVAVKCRSGAVMVRSDLMVL